jgi:carboxypeptidase T
MSRLAPFRLAVVRLALVPVLASGLAWSGAAAQPPTAAAVEPNFPATMSGYHNYVEMVAEVRQAAVSYPSIVKVFSIGKSYQGRDILAAKISDNVGTDEDEPEVLIDALHHAREHLSTEQALAVLRWLTKGYGTDTTVTRLVNTREIYIIFAMNPDGLRYDLTGSPFRAWRKNRQPNAGTTAIGTDLNRNYAYRFGCCGGSSGNPSSLTYRGPRAFSAPETQAFRDFVNSRVINGVQQIRTHITLHTNGKQVLWPYGYTRTDVPADMTTLDHAGLAKLGREMAALNGYTPMQSSDLYVTDGDQIDWLYGQYRIFSYTFELYPAETGSVSKDFYPDDSHIAAETARNRSAILLLIDRAGCPYQGLGTNYARVDCGPLYDDLEINRGWVRNASGTDTATGGTWQIGKPAATAAGGPKQPGTAYSGRYALVTGTAAGTNANANDVDGGTTSIRGRPITLPADPAAFGLLTIRYSFAHDAASTAEDSFQVLVETGDGTQTPVFTVAGGAANRDASWAYGSASLAPWAGQTIRLVFAATDGGANNLVEAAVDDIRIRRP